MKLNLYMLQKLLKNKIILITGGTGSFGSNLAKYLLKLNYAKKIIIYSRDELKQFELKNYLTQNFKNSNKVRFFIGDVRDYERLLLASKDVDILIHAAALKHVPIVEYNPFEAVKTNINGAQNVISVSLENKINKIIALSTDKASAPINLYGATKLASDKLFIAANNIVGDKKIKFSVVRYGNVFGSRGSIIPFLLSQRDKDYYPITDSSMTRFHITLKQGIDFVLMSLSKMYGGEIFIPKLPSIKIKDIATALDPNKKIKIIGLREGEKIHEDMITEDESIHTIIYDNYFVIGSTSKYIKTPFFKIAKLTGGIISKKRFFYSSNTNNNYLTINQLKKEIKNFKNQDSKI